MLLGKIALGFCGTLLFAGVYTFRQGVIRVDVDEYKPGGSHVHLWLPATALPTAMHFVPKHRLEQAAWQTHECLPMIQAVMKELEKFPNAELVDVQDSGTHVKIGTQHGKLLVDVEEPGDTVHIICPVVTLQDVVTQIQDSAPAI